MVFYIIYSKPSRHILILHAYIQINISMINKCKLLLRSVPSWMWKLCLGFILAISLSYNVAQHYIINKHNEIRLLLIEQIDIHETEINDLNRYKIGYDYITITIGLSDSERAQLLDVVNALNDLKNSEGE